MTFSNLFYDFSASGFRFKFHSDHKFIPNKMIFVKTAVNGINSLIEGDILLFY